MRRRSRTARFLKWVSTTACLLVVTLWGFSYSRYRLIYIDYPYGTVFLERGRVCQPFSGRTPPALRGQEGWHVFRKSDPLPAVDDIYLPLWLPALLVGGPAAFLWYSDVAWWWRSQYPSPGHCQNCGYDLTGNVSGVCPECGTTVKREDKTP